RLHGHVAVRISLDHRVENGITYLIRHLVRMTLRHRLGGKETSGHRTPISAALRLRRSVAGLADRPGRNPPGGETRPGAKPAERNPPGGETRRAKPARGRNPPSETLPGAKPARGRNPPGGAPWLGSRREPGQDQIPDRVREHLLGPQRNLGHRPVSGEHDGLVVTGAEGQPGPDLVDNEQVAP